MILLSVDMRVTVVVIVMVVTVRMIMMIFITSLAPRNGVYTVPQHTYKRSLWRTWIFGWLEGRYDSLLDGSGHGSHVSGGTIG